MHISKNTAPERLEEYVHEKPYSVAAVYEPNERMTFGELRHLSGKIYAWLKSKGIGKEDVVMYCLPRGLMLYACMTGTMRAGAAFILTETENAVERTEYIRKDSNCKLFTDESCIEEILGCTPLEGYEPIDLHDDGKEVFRGEVGEICFKTPYVRACPRFSFYVPAHQFVLFCALRRKCETNFICHVHIKCGESVYGLRADEVSGDGA